MGECKRHNLRVVADLYLQLWAIEDEAAELTKKSVARVYIGYHGNVGLDNFREYFDTMREVVRCS